MPCCARPIPRSQPSKRASSANVVKTRANNASPITTDAFKADGPHCHHCEHEYVDGLRRVEPGRWRWIGRIKADSAYNTAMDYIPIADNAARQAIDSATVFEEFARVKKEASKYAGGMYWKRQGGYEYLVKTLPDNRQQRLGAKSSQTEEIYEGFTSRKHEVEARLASLRSALTDAERQNKALRVGRVPQPVVAVLQVIEDAGLGEHFTVVGTHSLYAYETAAGVRIVQEALATQDVDLLWDARKRVRLVTDLQKLDASMLEVLQRADPTFRRKPRALATAINDNGFEVDFLRRPPQDDDPHPFQFTDDEDDLWVVQARRADVLTEAPKFEQIVVSSTGRMALMRTIDPRTFVEFKRWMGSQAPGREHARRNRDLNQARIVQALLDEGLLVSQVAAPVGRASKRSATEKKSASKAAGKRPPRLRPKP